MFDAKPLGIRSNQIDGFIRVYDGTSYLVLFESEKHDFIYNRIRCLVGVKNGVNMLFLIIMEKLK